MYSDQQVEAARIDPAVVHYTDRPKPWHRECTHPWASQWLEVAAETEFAPIALERTPTSYVIRRRVKRAASALLKGT